MKFSAKIIAIVCAMAVEEGFFRQGTIPFDRKNPGDLTKWGDHPLFGRFVQFDTIVDGFEALAEDVEVNEAKGLTLAQFIAKFAPPTENNTSGYLQFVSEFTGIDPTDII